MNAADEDRPFQYKEPKRKNYREKMLERMKSGEMPIKKKKALRKVSKKGAERLKEYNKSNPLNGINCCASCGSESNLERHHPYGRGRDNITKWIWVCASNSGCGIHDKIHSNPNEYFKLGWLQPEYRGLDPYNFPNHPKPWE